MAKEKSFISRGALTTSGKRLRLIRDLPKRDGWTHSGQREKNRLGNWKNGAGRCGRCLIGTRPNSFWSYVEPSHQRRRKTPGSASKRRCFVPKSGGLCRR